MSGTTLAPVHTLRFHGRRWRLFPRTRSLRNTPLTVEPLIQAGEPYFDGVVSYKAPDHLAGFDLRLSLNQTPLRLARWLIRQPPGLFEFWTVRNEQEHQAADWPWIYWAFPQVEWGISLEGQLIGHVGYSEKQLADTGLPIHHGGWLYTKEGPP